MSFEPRSVFIFDLETAINEKAEAFLKTADLGYDSRLKDPVKVEASKIERRETAVEKAALSWWYGRIVSIAFCGDDLVIPEAECFSARNLSEKEIIENFFVHVETLAEDGLPLLVGKNSSSFDNGYLIGRCLALNIGVPLWLRPYRQIEDIDQIFSMKSGAACTGKLSEYAFGIGMEKSGSGSDVAAMVKEGRWDDLEKYNKMDVLITAEIYNRFMKQWRRNVG